MFEEVIQAAWHDFNNPKIFAQGKDAIALITGPLSATDGRIVRWLLNQARHTKNVDEFIRHVKQAKFSPTGSDKKLQVIKDHLIAASDKKISKEELYNFLRHFHLLGYDLGDEVGITLSLLHSHISQFHLRYPIESVWSRIVGVVQTWNKDAGTITRDNLPDDFLKIFEPKVVEMPNKFQVSQKKTNWAQHSDATYLAFAVLIGAWNEKSQSDLEVFTQFLSINYETWLQKGREILHCPDNLLSLKNGIWKVENRANLWTTLGSRIFDRDLDTFKNLAITVLKKPDPAFELPIEQRYAASIYGRVLEHSPLLRDGIAEGLAILGSQPKACSNCSQGKAEATCELVLREIFANADWIIWGSLNSLLPTLAEASPDEFLDHLEKALHLKPCPFDELFAQEGNGITGGNYLTGLLWALEGLAWHEQYFVRVCVVLGELASHDPGGRWANRPFNSLVTILLPWLPQTLASFDKRKVAVETLKKELPNIAWRLIIRLLPGQLQNSSGSHKPNWRRIPDDWKPDVTEQEYRDQVSFYARLAVDTAGYDTARLSELIDVDNLPKPAFDQLIAVLASEAISELPEDQRLSLWEHLTKLTCKYRQFANACSLPDELITHIENVTEQLTPTNPFNRHQHLFNHGFDLFYDDENGILDEQQKKMDARRKIAIREILQQNDINGVIRFAEIIDLPYHVGYALGSINDEVIESTILPALLNTPNTKHKDFVSGFIHSQRQIKGLEWGDNFDKSGWTSKQIGHFLACLPFTKETWDRASQWLGANQEAYWTRTDANIYYAGSDLTFAIDKLIEHGRSHSALNCLGNMRDAGQPINAAQCVRALLTAVSSNEPTGAVDEYNIVELIKFLQSESSTVQEDLFKVEWAYLPLLDYQKHYHEEAAPKLLESRLASDPEFFCEVIRLIYRSNKEDPPSKKPSEKLVALANNGMLLLHSWKTPPGLKEDGVSKAGNFNEWLQHVKTICSESGHLEIAMSHVGEVLIYAPPDPGGLWIHQAVAKALNEPDSEHMRSGFRTGTYNSRGAHIVDPTGNQEKELAEKFHHKARDIENAGFHRFAAELRKLSQRYESEAERVINQYKDRD